MWAPHFSPMLREAGVSVACSGRISRDLRILEKDAAFAAEENIMNEHRRQILQMLSEGKISADEAERLISALEAPSSFSTFSDSGSSGAGKPRPKYLRVVVDAEEGSHDAYDGPTKVNVRVPMQLLRAGVRLAGLIPVQALNRANQAMQEKGVPIDLTQIKPENLEELVEQLTELTVDVDQKEAGAKVKVRVFCE